MAAPARRVLALALMSFAQLVAAAERDALSGTRLLPTEVIESLTLAAPTFSGTQRVRITHPSGRGRFPVVVLSQGARSTPALYGDLAAYWAARGHVVIQPVPPDLSPITTTGEAAARRLPATVESRLAEIRFIVGAFEQIETRARTLKGRLDRERLAVAGHSTGALAALLAAGPALLGTGGAAPPQGIPEVDALILIGDPAMSGVVPSGAWRTLAKPTLLATGSKDEGEAPGVQRPTALYALGAAPLAARHELFVRDMDTCLGGLICRAPPGTTPDPAALFAIAETTTAFLRAYLRGDAAAGAWLSKDAPQELANGRARLKVH